MRFDDERESSNVEDVRGDAGGGGGLGSGGLGGLLGLLPLLGGGGGGVVVLLVILGLIFGPRLLSGGAASPPATAPGLQNTPTAGVEDQDVAFIRKVTAYTEDTWSRVFEAQGRTYRPPVVTIYSQERATGCGEGQAAMGPFYCPADHHVYLDLSFFQELSSRFGAPGRFAQAYVIAHEVGHHVQTLLGTMQKADAARAQAGPGGSNPISVRTELQADCYAGVWAYQTNLTTHFLDPGDEAEALRAASAVGDDTLQKAAQGRVAPDSFTHGSAAQRTRWFDRGFQSGDMARCDTFSGDYADL